MDRKAWLELAAQRLTNGIQITGMAVEVGVSMEVTVSEGPGFINGPIEQLEATRVLGIVSESGLERKSGARRARGDAGRWEGDSGQRPYAHAAILSWVEGVYLFGVQDLASIREASLDVRVRQSGIVLKDLGLRPSLGHQVNDKLNRESRPTNDRLAEQDIRIYCNSLLPTPCFPFCSSGCIRPF